jgi:hypothetical protein
MWGQGLPENMKFRNIVAGWIQGVLGGRPVRQFAYAHSGAQIIADDGDSKPNLPGEIPSHHPSVTLQVSMAVNDVIAGAIDLVLLDGGINDVGVPSILLPTNGTGKIQQIADGTCVGRMGKLLQQVMTIFPRAAIVVTGYFPIASDQSDTIALTALISALGLGIAGPAGALLGSFAKDQMVRNSMTWKNATDSGFARLVSAANQQAGGPPRVAFASPTFGPENCFSTGPASFLFGVANVPLPVSASNVNGFYGDEAMGIAGVYEPADPLHDVQWKRARACVAAGRTDAFCPDACMGHPNPSGAQAYAAVVLSQIQTTLAPYLVSHGLVENPMCPSLRAQENTAMNTIRGAQDQLAEMGKEQQACQAGTDGLGPSHKPKECGALENEAEKKQLNAIMQQASAQLTVIRQRKRQAGCWY